MLKARIITTYDIQGLSPGENPLLYVPQTWSGTIESVITHTAVPLRNRIWVIVNFFDKKNWRKLILQIVQKICQQYDLFDDPFFSQIRKKYLDAVSGTITWDEIRKYTEAWVQIAYANYCSNPTAKLKAFARMANALKWAFTDEPFIYRYEFWKAIKDLSIVVSDQFIANEVLAVLDTHP